MCQAMEELCAWDRKRALREVALDMLQDGVVPPETIVKYFNISLEEAKEISDTAGGAHVSRKDR